MGSDKKRKRRKEPEITGTISVSFANATDLPPILGMFVYNLKSIRFAN
jgi:hypothetical protein